MGWLVLAAESTVEFNAIDRAVLDSMNSSSCFLFSAIVDKSITRLTMRIHRQIVLFNHTVHHISKSGEHARQEIFVHLRSNLQEQGPGRS
jgi:hypothetical protein